MVESIESSGPDVAIAKFRETYKSVSFGVRLMPAPAVIEALKRGDCDIAIGFCVARDPELRFAATFAEPIVVAVPNAHPLASATRIAPAELARWPLALPDSEFGIRRILDRTVARMGVELAPILSSNSFETLRNAVRSGECIAVLPTRAVSQDVRAGTLKTVALSGSTFANATLDIITLAARRLPRITKLFLDVLVGQFQL